MGAKVNLAGQKFGRLLVLYDTGERKNKHVVWHCRCDCGNEVDARGDNLTSGLARSCGCYNRERVAEVQATHGMSRHGGAHPVYWVWHGMLQRCKNPNDKRYKYYGGRGITVCDEWHDAEKFIGWAVLNGWEKGLTLDRIDNNGNYKPDNCRWVTRKVQSRNMRSNHLIAFNGKTQTIAEWAEEIGINGSTLYNRINVSGWPIERALAEPVKQHLTVRNYHG